jgi:hypothetical protein
MTNGPIKRSFNPNSLMGKPLKKKKKKKKKKKDFEITPEGWAKVEEEMRRRGWTK